MATKTKNSALCAVKAGPKDGLGEFEFAGYASVFGNKDSYGDVVEPGAFAESLKAWGDSGLKIPVYWSHKTDDPAMNIGYVVKAEEDDHGLKVHAKLDSEGMGAKVHQLLKEGRVGQMSFMYEVNDGEMVIPMKEGGGKDYENAYYSLKELKLHEVSVVQVGANQATEITDVKALADELAVKAGRTLSSKTEDALRGAVESLESALESVKSVLPTKAKDEDDEEEDDTDADESDSDDEDEDDDKPSGKSLALASARLKVLALRR